MIFHSVWILTSIKVILCHVNTDTKLLQDEFFNNTSSKTWFDQGKMQDNAKFLLCVDVYQKIVKQRVMEGRFITKEGYNNISLLNFSLHDVIVIDAYNETDRYKFVISILCPFSSIAFEKNANNYGVDFYITPKQDAFCVYMLSVNFRYPNGTTFVQITAEVCNVMTDIRIDQEELMTELISNADIHLMRQHKWEPFQENNTLRYLTCLDVYEKNTGMHLCSRPIDVKLPIFKKVEVVLPHISQTKILSTILCDMRAIKFSNKKYITINPYYIAPSVNKGCVYKLELISSDQSGDLIGIDYMGAVKMQQEICGIFEPVRRDISQLEKEFLDTFNDDAQWFETEPIPWTEIQSLAESTIHALKICENVCKKIHHNAIIRKKILHRMTVKVLHLRFRTITGGNRSVRALYCPLHLFNEDQRDIRPYYLTNSVNIGCVYVLFSQKRQLTSFIEYEVCGVYPIQYLFNIRYN